MPDFLSDGLPALRERLAVLAQGPLAALRDDAALAPADRAARVRALAKAAGVISAVRRLVAADALGTALWAVDFVARLQDSGQDPVNESIAAKVIATETAGQLVDQAIQLVGGEALVTDHALEAALRRLRALRLAEGETDVLQVNLARGFLELGKGRLSL